MSSWSSTRPQVQQFEYINPRVDGQEDPQGPTSGVDSSCQIESEHSLALAEAYERGTRESLAEAQARFEQQITNLQQQIQSAVEQFTEERRDYFKRIETDVVQLSLAIARRVIGHEASIDDCLLGGMVRVALEQLDRGTHVRIHIRPDIAERWKPKLAWTQTKSVEWVPDSSLSAEVCRLETELGSTEIGVELKLKEVEQSFMELLCCRPDANHVAATQ